MKTGTAVVVGILLGGAAIAADEKPDFSGVWKHAEANSSIVYTIEHKGAGLSIAYESQFTGGPLSSGLMGTETYVIDGVEKARKSDKGREYWTTVGWEGPSVVILRVSKDGYRVTVTRETWTLSPDGLTLTKGRRTINMDGVTESAQTFQKQ